MADDNVANDPPAEYNRHAYIVDIRPKLTQLYEDINIHYFDRLSGGRLPIELCYIDVTILDPVKKATSRWQNPFNIQTRRTAGGAENNARIPLSSMFNPRKRNDGRVAPPRRVLIEGHAGVGKTTLCKKIVYEYLNNDMWRKMFDLILWIPLRRLKAEYGEDDRTKLFYHLYFWDHEHGREYAQALSLAADDPSVSSRILFVLDGLDEVAQEWDHHPSMHGVIKQLLNHSRVIITSRPGGQGVFDIRGSIDLVLEATGFLPDQVQEYVHNTYITQNPKVIQELDTFLKQNKTVKELMRIPVQLDALCYSWEPEFLQEQDEPRTMTAVYNAVMWKMWKKDALKLKKQLDGSNLSSFRVRGLGSDIVGEIVQKEMNMLEGLAFHGLVNDIIDLSSNNCQSIALRLRQQGTEFPSDIESTLGELSFCRISDPGESYSFHFIHLTFQELFAARYYVECCMQQRPLLYLILNRKKSRRPESVEITTTAFFHMHKYNARYEGFWRFVSGLLETHERRMYNSTPLVDFLRELASQPQDLLVWTHQRLLMNCISETWFSQQSGLDPLREKLEKSLLDWASFLCNREADLADFRTANPADFFDSCPGHILCFLLHSDSEEVQGHALASLLSQRATVPADDLEHIVTVVKKPVSMDLKMNGLKLLLQDDESPVQETMNCLKNFLRQCDIREVSWKEGLSRTFADALISLLDHQNPLIKNGIFHILVNSEYMTNDILDSFRFSVEDDAGDNDDDDDDDDEDESDSASSEHDLSQLVEILQEEDSTAPKAFVKYLIYKEDIPEEALPVISSLLEDRSAEDRTRAFHTLMLQRQELPDNILEQLTTFVKDTKKSVWEPLIQEFCNTEDEPLSPQILGAIAELLLDPSGETRGRVKQILGPQPYIPQELFPFLQSLLSDEDINARLDILDVLRNAIDLPDDFTREVAGILSDPNRRLRQAAFEVLDCQLQPSDHVLSRLILFLRGPDRYQQVLQDLGPKSDRLILKHAASLLDKEAPGVLDEFVRRLGYQLSGSEVTLPILIRRLKDPSATVRTNTLKAFFPAGPLGPEMLEVIFTKWATNGIRKFASYLSRHLADWKAPDKPLPDHVMDAMLSSFDRDLDTRDIIIQLWAQQRHLPERAIKKLLPYLEDKNPFLVGDVEMVLTKQAAFYALLPGLRLSALRSLYSIWFERGGKPHARQSMYVADGTLFVDVSQGLHEVRFSDAQQKRVFLGHIQICQREMGLPLYD